MTLLAHRSRRQTRRHEADLSHSPARPTHAAWLYVTMGLLTFLWSNGAQISILQHPDYNNFLRLLTLVPVGLGVCMLFKQGLAREIWHDVYFRAILVLLLVIFVPTLITGVGLYGQGLVEVVRLPLPHYAMLIFVLLYCWVRPGQSLACVIAPLCVVIVAVALLYVAASFFPGLVGTMLTPSSQIEDRFNRIRLSGGAINNLVVFVSLYCVVLVSSDTAPKLTRRAALLALPVLFYYLTYVLASRTRLFVVGGCIVVHCVLGAGNARRRIAIILTAALALLAGELVMADGPITRLTRSYESLVEETTHDRGNVGIRFDCMQYYWNEFVASGYVGTGLLSAARYSDAGVGEGMLKGYNLADIGIAAVLFEFGLQGIIVTVWLVVRLYKDTREVRKRGTGYSRDLAVAIQLYLLFYIVSGYHIFLWYEYAFEWGVLLFAVSLMRRSLELPGEVTSRNMGALQRKAVLSPGGVKA